MTGYLVLRALSKALSLSVLEVLTPGAGLFLGLSHVWHLLPASLVSPPALPSHTPFSRRLPTQVLLKIRLYALGKRSAIYGLDLLPGSISPPGNEDDQK